MVFAADDFLAVLKDYQSPDVTDRWTFVTETGGLKVYKRLRSGSENDSLFEYKVFGTLEADASTAFQVYMDTQYRCKWDGVKPEHLRLRTRLVDEQQHQSNDTVDVPLTHRNDSATDLSARPESIYWRVKYPMFMSDRDYVFVREAREMVDEHGQTCYVVLAQSDTEEQDSEPLSSGVIRVSEYEQSVVFAPGPDAASQCAVYMLYFENPKGSIPTTVINWAVSTGVPTFLKNLKAACKNYGQDEASAGAGAMGVSEKGVKELKETLDQSLSSAFTL
ncbi:hypothetical protein RI367_002699 [Sorochytrium milnesiophthora]